MFAKAIDAAEIIFDIKSRYIQRKLREPLRMTIYPCGSRNLYCFLHQRSAVPPFYIDSPRSVRPRQWGLSQNTCKASPDNHRNSFSSWYGSSRKCGRHHHPYTVTRILFLLFSASSALQRERSTLHTNRTAGGRLRQSHLSRNHHLHFIGSGCSVFTKYSTAR